jgi:hypothetical protein
LQEANTSQRFLEAFEVWRLAAATNTIDGNPISLQTKRMSQIGNSKIVAKVAFPKQAHGIRLADDS